MKITMWILPKELNTLAMEQEININELILCYWSGWSLYLCSLLI